jgi:hypothetical protein
MREENSAVDGVTRRQAVDDRIRQVGLVQAGTELKVAAILFTYRCTISCRHCLFACRGARPDVVMDAERCVRYLAQLHELGRVVHIAGGEPVLYWEVLAEVLDRAVRAGVAPHFIETNCSFAGDDAVVRDRFTLFRQRGLFGVLLSADPYHQAHVRPENFLRARRIAREIFGAKNVWASDVSGEQVREYACIGRDEGRLAEYVRAGPPSLTGSAYAELAPFVQAVPINEMPPPPGSRTAPHQRHCAGEFDAERIWEVHIDPYDNIQTNCVILGRADRTPVAEVMARGPAQANFIARTLSEAGPIGLAEFARREHGFRIPQTTQQKCALCFVTRCFLRKYYPRILGPGEIYD